MKIEAIDEVSDGIEIGRWKLSEEYGILDSPLNKELLLEPRLSKLLYTLGSNACAVVSRNYLVSTIWKDTIVNEESLTRAVADLRKVLKYHFGSEVSILTIPKRGYKLIFAESPQKGRGWLKGKYSVKYAIYGFLLFFITVMWLAGFLKVMVHTP